jgi:multidrug resistance efflux pump
VQAGDLLVRMTDPEAEASLAEVRGLIAQAEARLAEAQARLGRHSQGRDAARANATDPAAFDVGTPFAPGDFHDIRLRLEQDTRLIELELRALRSERGRLRDRSRALEVLAPQAGRIDRVLVPVDSYQRVGTPLLVFETDAPRRVIGWLDASEAAHVWQGMRASVRYSVAGETRTATAVVAAIEAGSDPLRPDAYGLLVYLDLAGLALAETRALLPHNAAVEVRLHRDLAQRWFGMGG